MAKVCPPGVLCIENITIVILMVLIGGLLYVQYYQNIKNRSLQTKQHKEFINTIAHKLSKPETIIKQTTVNNDDDPYFTKTYNRFSSLNNDILLNPYEPPLKDDAYFLKHSSSSTCHNKNCGINIQTNIHQADIRYRQIGVLLPREEKFSILPLMARPLYTNRYKWQYYTLSDQNNSIKLPIYIKDRNCMNEYGCDELYTNDVAWVEGHNTHYKISLYEKPQYYFS